MAMNRDGKKRSQVRKFDSKNYSRYMASKEKIETAKDLLAIAVGRRYKPDYVSTLVLL